MGILIPTQTLTGPQNPLVGALTGLTQGLAQGIPIAEQIKRRKEESDRQNIELAQQQGQLNRRNSREDASKRAAQALLRASMMNAGAPSNGSGTSSPPGATAGSGAPALSGFQTLHPGAAPGDLFDFGQEQGPGTGGSPLQGPPEQGPAGQQTGYSGGHPPTGNPGTDWLFEQMHNGSLKDISVEEAEKISEAHARDLHLQAVTEHAGRLSNTIQRGLDKGLYDAVDEDGAPDPSARIAMEGMQRRIQSLDRTDPRAAAALLDQAEQMEDAARQHQAASAAKFDQRQAADQGFQADMQNRLAQPRQPGQPDVAYNEMTSLYRMWKAHKISDEAMGKAWIDASNGTFQIKRDMERLQYENEVLKNQATTQGINEARLKQYWDTPEGRAQMQALIGGREATVAGIRAGRGFKPPGPGEVSEARKNIAATLDSEFPRHGFSSETDEDKAAWKARKAELEEQTFGSATPSNGRAGSAPEPETGAGSNEAQGGQESPSGAASVLWRLFKKGRIGKDELKRRAEKAGLTPDDFKAFAGAK